LRKAQNACLPIMRFNSDRTVVPLPDLERLPGGSVADPLWTNSGRTGLPGSASRGARPAAPTGVGGVVTPADICASCSWPSSGAVSHTPVGIDTPEADELSVGILPGDGQPRFVWDELPVTRADYMGVLVASVMDAAAGGLSTRPPTSRPRTWLPACVQPSGNNNTDRARRGNAKEPRP